MLGVPGCKKSRIFFWRFFWFAFSLVFRWSVASGAVNVYKILEKPAPCFSAFLALDTMGEQVAPLNGT